nr:MAG TPA: hypothetical protein [Caudoviricetes sp.]
MATLCELQSVYSYEDLLDFYEIVVVNNINEYRAMEEAKRNNGR